MMKVIALATVSALALAATVSTQPAYARNRNNDGAVAAGIIGGIAAGAIIGSQINRDDGYRDRGYYRSGYRECRIERRDYEDRYGRLHVRNVRVCD